MYICVCMPTDRSPVHGIGAIDVNPYANPYASLKSIWKIKESGPKPNPTPA